jgi:hypothetical protein
MSGYHPKTGGYPNGSPPRMNAFPSSATPLPDAGIHVKTIRATFRASRAASTWAARPRRKPRSADIPVCRIAGILACVPCKPAGLTQVQVFAFSTGQPTGKSAIQQTRMSALLPEFNAALRTSTLSYHTTLAAHASPSSAQFLPATGPWFRAQTTTPPG